MYTIFYSSILDSQERGRVEVPVSVRGQSVEFFDKTVLLILFSNVSVSDTNHQTNSIAISKSCHKRPFIFTL